MGHRVLIVEDEPELLTVLRDNLGFEGYDVVAADTGEQALVEARRARPDLVLLDVMLPRMSGLEVCERLRRDGGTFPIIMLTARNTEVDRVAGLELGASDYVGKPFSLRELVARVRAHLRRFDVPALAPRLVQFGDLTVDLEARLIRRGTTRLTLSPHEFDLLRYFVLHAGQVVTRQQLLSDVWRYNDAVNSRTADNFVAKLRRKVEPNPDEPRYIITVHGSGYLFVSDADTCA